MLNKIKNIKHLESNNFFLIAGPCAIEGEKIAIEIAEKIFEITARCYNPQIFSGQVVWIAGNMLLKMDIG